MGETDELLTRRDWVQLRAQESGMGLGAAILHTNSVVGADPQTDWDVERWTPAEWEGIERQERLERRLRGGQ